MMVLMMKRRMRSNENIPKLSITLLDDDNDDSDDNKMKKLR